MSRKIKITNKLTDEDSERLIGEIRQRPTIWDRHDEHYRNHVARNACWTEVVEAMNDNDEGKHFPKELLRKCWTNLKDRFVRARREMLTKWEATNADKQQNTTLSLQGKFFDQLSFLADTNKIPTGMENEQQRYYELNGNGGRRDSSVPFKKQQKMFGLGGGDDEEMSGYNDDVEDSLANESYHHHHSSSINQRYHYQPSSDEFIPSAAKRPRKYLLAFSPPTPINDFPATSGADNESGLATMAAKYTEIEPFAQNVNNVHKMLVEGRQRKMALELKRRINQLADEFEAKFYEATTASEDHE